MIRRPPRSTRTDTLFPYTTLFRSHQARVPHACPDCGDQDLKPMGRGTQRIEEYLAELFPQARVARIDADSTRLKGSAAALFAKVHAGDVDLLVGTQMVAKGHDFTNLGLVGVLNADAMRSEEHTSELQSLMRISYAVFCLK